MAKKSKIVGNELVLIAKAIRRGEKLERTLTKLVAFNEPQTHAETFLKAVTKGLERLRTDEASIKDEGNNRSTKAKVVQSRKPSEKDISAPVVGKRGRKQAKSDAAAVTEAEVAQAVP